MSPTVYSNSTSGESGALSDQALGVVRAAAVMSADVDVWALAAVVGLSFDRLLELLAEAEIAGVLQPVSGASGRFAFAAPSTAEALLSELPWAEQVKLRAQAVIALERHWQDEREAHAGTLAEIAVAALPILDPEVAYGYCRTAAMQAAERFAFAEAARWCSLALEALNYQQPRDDRRYGQTLAECAWMFQQAGMETELRPVGRQLAELARRLGDAELMMNAAGIYHRGSFTRGFGGLDLDRLALLEEALVMIRDDQPEMKLYVLTGMANILLYDRVPDRRKAVAAQILDIARGHPTAPLLTTPLTAAAHALCGAVRADLRLPIIIEAQKSVLPGAHASAHHMQVEHARVPALLELGEVAAARDAVANHAHHAQLLGRPLFHHYRAVMQGALALLDGRFAEARLLMEEGKHHGLPVRPDQANLFYTAQLLVLGWETGGLEPLVPVLEQTVASTPDAMIGRVLLAVARMETGDISRSWEPVHSLVLDDFGTLPKDGQELAMVALLADLCARTGQGGRAARLYQRYVEDQPYCAVMGAVPAACLGSMEHWLGVLAATVAEHGGSRSADDPTWPEVARRHLEQAIAFHDRVGARPLAARGRLALAQLLVMQVGRDSPELCAASADREGARMLLAAARTEAEALAMAPLLSRCDALAVQLREGGGRGIGLRLPDRLTRKELEVLRMVASGLSNREVAERLAISLNTVERHINHLFDKTKVENRVALVNYALRLGLLG